MKIQNKQSMKSNNTFQLYEKVYVCKYCKGIACSYCANKGYVGQEKYKIQCSNTLQGDYRHTPPKNKT